VSVPEKQSVREKVNERKNGSCRVNEGPNEAEQRRVRIDEGDVLVRTVMGENEGVGRGNVRERAFVRREAEEGGGQATEMATGE